MHLNGEKLVDLRVDFAFKALFGRPGREHLLVDFLNELLHLQGEGRIRHILHKNSEIFREYEQDKKSFLDLFVETNAGYQINLEIQIANQYDMRLRTLYHWSRMFSLQMRKKMSYSELCQTITINLLDFTEFAAIEDYHTTYELLETRHHSLLTDRLSIHFIELPKLYKQWKLHQANPRFNRVARWLLLLLAAGDNRLRMELEGIAMEKDLLLKEAFEHWAEMSLDESTLIAYEARRKQILDELSIEREMELRLERGLKEGLEKGIKEGLEQGLEQGLEKGLEQGLEKGLVQGLEKGIERGKRLAQQEMALAMRGKGMDVQSIAELTGLSAKEIEEL